MSAFCIVATAKTKWPSDSLEFNPAPDSAGVFAVGTYKLVEEPKTGGDLERDGSEASDGSVPRKRKREGQIHLYTIDDQWQGSEGSSETEMNTAIRSLATIDHDAAVLDLRWTSRKINGRSALVVGDSIAGLTVYSGDVSAGNTEVRLDRLARYLPEDAADHTDLLTLSLDISSKLNPSESPSILATYNTGAVEVLGLASKSASLEPLARIENAHALEAWTCCWDHHEAGGSSVFYTGGDDAVFRKWDIRVGTSRSILQDKSSHQAGVTSLLVPPIPSQPHWLITGSYDEHMLLWDSRFLKPGRHLLDYHNEGGGVWRVKMLPDLEEQDDDGRKAMTVAIAGMHRGFEVVRIDETASSIASVPISAPTALAYGVDISHDASRRQRTGKMLVGGCSFYDCTVQLWEC